MILLDTGLKHVKPHQVVHVGQEAIINPLSRTLDNALSRAQHL